MMDNNVSLKQVIDGWVGVTQLNKRKHATEQAYHRYLESNDRTLNHVYDKYSTTKAYAYNYIMNEMRQVNGCDFKIISFNTNMFTCGYCVDLNGETYFVRHTAYYRDCIKVG